MTGIQLTTEASLLDTLQRAARRTLSAKEIQQQKISFIMGSLGDDSTVTREQVSKVLADQQGDETNK